MNTRRLDRAIKRAKMKIAIQKLMEIGASYDGKNNFFISVDTESKQEKLKQVRELQQYCKENGVKLTLCYYTRSRELEGLE